MTRAFVCVAALALVHLPLAADTRDKEPVKQRPLPPPPADDTLAPARSDPALLDRSEKRALAKRNIGLGLAVPGIALSVLGGVLVGFGVNSKSLFDQVDKVIAGVITGGVGLVIGIPGVYLWTNGQDDMDSVAWRRRQLVK